MKKYRSVADFEEEIENLDWSDLNDAEVIGDAFEKLWDWLDEDTKRIFVDEVMNA